MRKWPAAVAMLIAGAIGVGGETRAQPDMPAPVVVPAGHLPYVRSIDPRFQSFQIGFSHLTGGETWRSYDDLPAGQAQNVEQVRQARAPADLASPRLRALATALSPFYLRYSGTTANSAFFQESAAPPPASAPAGFTVLLTRERWRQALEFARAVDARVVTSFANSDGVRDVSGGWTPRMAAPWLAYTRSVGGRIWAAELFNEPNAPEPPRIPRGFSPEQFARDFARFRTATARLAPDMRIAGPGAIALGIPGVSAIGGGSVELYAAATPRPRFDIVSYHFYPVLAQRCASPTSPQGISADHALDEAFLARPDATFQQVRAVRDSRAPGAPIWLTETGGAACGGLIWQPTFLDVFRFLDTEARLARQGLDVMFTHALISGSNGIIDEHTLEPNASYWAAVLWRRLMGIRVLDAGPNRAGLHLYAHCLRGSTGGVVVLAINLKNTADAVTVPGPVQVYMLTAPQLQSRTVLLNGRALTLAGNRLPDMRPVATRDGHVALGPTSIAFIALPDARNPACASTR